MCFFKTTLVFRSIKCRLISANMLRIGIKQRKWGLGEGRNTGRQNGRQGGKIKQENIIAALIESYFQALIRSVNIDVLS